MFIFCYNFEPRMWYFECCQEKDNNVFRFCLNSKPN